MFPRCFTAIGTGAVGALCPGGEEAGRARVLASGPGCGRIDRRPAWRPAIPSFAVLTSSDTGAREADFADVSGDTVVEMMLGAGFDLSDRRLLPDDEDALAGAIQEWCDRGEIDIVLTTGGTGLGPGTLRRRRRRASLNTRCRASRRPFAPALSRRRRWR